MDFAPPAKFFPESDERRVLVVVVNAAVKLSVPPVDLPSATCAVGNNARARDAATCRVRAPGHCR